MEAYILGGGDLITNWDLTVGTKYFTDLYWYDKMTSIFKEIVSIYGNNTSLIRLSNISKNGIHHA